MIPRMPQAFVLAISILPAIAFAQASAPAAASGAVVSKPAPLSPKSANPAKPGTKLMTQDQKLDTANYDMQNERPVVNQFSMPLGKVPPAPASPGTRAPGTYPKDGIDDAAARCGALVSAQARADCRDKLAKDAKSR
jgi:hypothetical protein